MGGLKQFLTFIIRVYIKYWFVCQIPTSAPNNDLQLLKDLQNFRAINDEVGSVVFSKFTSHLWYLSERLIGLSFFDSTINLETKRKMVESLEKPGHPDNPKRTYINNIELSNATLANFVTNNTYDFFNILFHDTEISYNFLKEDPSTWNNNKDYVKAKKIVEGLKIVNDIAERGISLITKFNPVLTHQENQKQYLIQCMADNYNKLDLKHITKQKLLEFLKKK